MGTRGSFLEIQRPGLEADHSHPSSGGVKNAWSYNPFPNTLPWRGAQLKESTGTTLLYLYFTTDTTRRLLFHRNVQFVFLLGLLPVNFYGCGTWSLKLRK
jgi:hypothetical protein